MYLEPVNNVHIYIYQWPFRAHPYDIPVAVDKRLLPNIFARHPQRLGTLSCLHILCENHHKSAKLATNSQC